MSNCCFYSTQYPIPLYYDYVYNEQLVEAICIYIYTQWRYMMYEPRNKVMVQGKEWRLHYRLYTRRCLC